MLMLAAAPDVTGPKQNDSVKDKSPIVSCSSEELQEEYGLAQGQNKYVDEKSRIVRCTWEDPQEKNALAEVNERITSLEASVDELGGHFVKYQQDFVSIIVQECARLTQQINELGLKIQNQAQVQLRESLSRAKVELWSKMTTEWARMKCNEKMTRLDTPQDTASTACTGENLVEHDELMRVMDGLRKDADEAHNKLGARADATEKRLAALEQAMEAQQKNANSLHSGELDASERRWASRVKASETFKAVLQPATDVTKSKPREPSPACGTPKMTSDVSKMLDGLVASVQRGAPASGTATPIRSRNVEAECRGISQSAMRKASESGCLSVVKGKTMHTLRSDSATSKILLEASVPRSASTVPAHSPGAALSPRASRPVSPQPAPVPLRSSLRMPSSVGGSQVALRGALSYTPVSSVPSRPVEYIQKTTALDKIMVPL